MEFRLIQEWVKNAQENMDGVEEMGNEILLKINDKLKKLDTEKTELTALINAVSCIPSLMHEEARIANSDYINIARIALSNFLSDNEFESLFDMTVGSALTMYSIDRNAFIGMHKHYDQSCHIGSDLVRLLYTVSHCIKLSDLYTIILSSNDGGKTIESAFIIRSVNFHTAVTDTKTIGIFSSL